MEERHVLSSVEASRWLVTLHSAFQDEHNLYLVMDYVPGGDLSTLLWRLEEGDIDLDVDGLRFYAAELVLALEELHNLNYMHR
jgi:serine/threonine protein kinase